MNIDSVMNSADLARTKMEVDSLNKILAAERAKPKTELDKDDFLKILVTQLQHQDPTNPVQDREFIAQMAQFSSLEQITNMAGQFGKMANLLNSSEAQSLLGKHVDILDGDKNISGQVDQIVRGEFPLVMVGGVFYDLDQVSRVYN